LFCLVSIISLTIFARFIEEPFSTRSLKTLNVSTLVEEGKRFPSSLLRLESVSTIDPSSDEELTEFDTSSSSDLTDIEL